MAKQFKDDPLAAMQRVPGMLNSLDAVTGALGEAIPALSGVSQVMKDMTPAVKTLSSVAGQVKQAAGQQPGKLPAHKHTNILTKFLKLSKSHGVEENNQCCHL